MKLKEIVWRMLGKDPEAVVVSFCSGPAELAFRMVEEVKRLVPDREHFAVSDYDVPGVQTIPSDHLPGPLRGRRIGLAPTLFAGERNRIQLLAFRYAPLKVLAFNRHLERHHLRLTTLIASTLFLRGVPLDRIWLRPRWLIPWKSDRSTWPDTHTEFDGHALRAGRRRVAVLSPYFPYPLSHGGAVRIYNLLREASRDFDVFLFAFAEKTSAAEGTPVLDICAKVVLFPNPRYREPRWATVLPPEVHEYRSPYVARVLGEYRSRYDIRLLQAEYTQMVPYGGDVLVEHDVTFDLYSQVHAREQTRRSWWDLERWRRFERAAVQRYPAVVVMSDKDAGLLGTNNTHVIPNGVDLHRFRPEPESNGARILFVGSFAHFPNVLAFRWFMKEVWPRLHARIPDAVFTVIAGRNADVYEPSPVHDEHVEFHGFIGDVRPFYANANVVVVPTRVSAGTNLKVLEAMASQRAIVSTTSGCAGIEVRDGIDIVIEDEAAAFADAVASLLRDFGRRSALARAGRDTVERLYGWDRIGVRQRALWLQLLEAPGVRIRHGRREDIAAIERIQSDARGASRWEAETYFRFDVQVAERNGVVCGFAVTRRIAPDEAEVLNIAVEESERRRGVATALIETIPETDVFLEVRESNEAAQRLYRKLGFREVGRREDYYEDPPETAIVMRRSRSMRYT